MTDTFGPTETGRVLGATRRNSARVVAYLPDGSVRSAPLLDTLDIGRAPSNGLALRVDGRVSGSHARLQRRGAGWELTDLGARNGVFADGARIHRATVGDGSVLRCGDTLIIIEDRGATEPDREDRSREMLTHLGRLWALSHSDRSVLVLGPTGSGKSHLVRQLHAPLSGRVPLVSLNCAAIPRDLVASELFGHARGAFSGAHTDKRGIIEGGAGGIVFLDEIGELAPALQAQLLHVVETGHYRRVGDAREHTIRTRWVAATNVDIEAQMATGQFRRDLYYRLAQEVFVLSGLRDRRVDIVPLALHALGAPDHNVGSPEALEALLLWSWPGNVRELLNLLSGLRGGRLDYESLPAAMTAFLRAPERDQPADAAPRTPAAGPPTVPARPIGRERPAKSNAPPRAVLEHQLAEAGGNVSELARRLGRHRNQVVRWLDYYGLR